MSYFLKRAEEDQFVKQIKPQMVLETQSARIVAVNPSFEMLTGYSSKVLMEKQWDVLFAFRNGQQDSFAKSLSAHSGEVNKLLSLTFKDGRKVFASLEIKPTSDKDYALASLSYNLSPKDIIDLFNKEQRFKEQFIQNLKDGVVITNKDMMVIDVNDAYLKMTGIERDEILGTIPPYHWPKQFFNELVDARVSGKESDSRFFEATFIHKDGSSFPVSISISVLRNDEGEVSSIVTVVRDRSALIKSERLLENEREFSSRIINGLQEGLIIIDPTGLFMDANPAFLEMIGFTREEIIGIRPPFPYWPPEHMDAIVDSFKNIMDKANKAAQLTFMRKNGERFPALVSVAHLRDEHGEITAHVGSIADITERYQFENKLRLANEFSESLINSLHEGLLVMDLESIIIDVNPAFCRMMGVDSEDLIGTSMPFNFISESSLKDFESCAFQVQQGISYPRFDAQLERMNGSSFPVSVKNAIIRDKDGAVIAHFFTIQDISDQVRLIESQKMLAVSSKRKKDAVLELAGLVGIDFNHALKRITSLAADVVNVERVSIWRLNKDQSEAWCENLYTASTGEHTSGGVLLEKDHKAYFESLQRYKTITVTNSQNHEFTKSFSEDYLKPNGITSCMDVLVQGTDSEYGILVFEHVGPMRIWSSEEEHFATSIASLVSMIIQSDQRKKAEQKLQAVNLELSETVQELNKLKGQLEDENVYLRKEIEMRFNFEDMVYSSAVFSDVLTNLEQVAPTTANVLLLGETGTGKELLARAVHNLSERKDAPLIKVNCGAIPTELIESELFGHKKGAFTGATSDKQGKVELANGGTIFLDEIGELPMNMQPKLLRFLQEGEIEVVGDPKVRKVDVRVIAATNKNLKEEVANNQFREDLYFRLNVFPIRVPALRERPEDIPVLIDHFVTRFSKKYRKNIEYISDATMRKLSAYGWPGNVRELENLIERAVILSNSETLRIVEFETPQETLDKSRSISLHKSLPSLDDAQRLHIIKALEQCEWKINGDDGAASLLQIKPSTLRDRMKKLDIKRPA
ncbi:sigma 54-interacting transcriptional regulator [Gilvibacter sp.]|uniref:sigma 54-interacting transcriptional regulator n=1 Tax=Gilvibacter sp. TaxID=2729997 RepID=UPI0025BF10E9|nr:sigma 54-interacting transcriptional regulator [Gilvibacter sp.]NQX76850.1 sigma 54-interacting transcriptional regulator [Gilvibacter sp.]